METKGDERRDSMNRKQLEERIKRDNQALSPIYLGVQVQ